MWARIENGVVMERVTYDPANFHPTGEWVECSDDVQDNWTYANGKFTEPVREAPAATPDLPEQFRGLGLSDEAIAAVKAGAKTLAQAVSERGPIPVPTPVEE